MKIRAILSLLLSLVLLTMAGCGNKDNPGEGKTDEQIAADYVQTLGYTIVAHEGEPTKYTLEQKMLENLDYMQLWGVQKQEPDAYFGKEIVTYPFIVKDHPLEQQYSPDDYRISVSVMIVDSKVIGGISGPLSKVKNLVMAGGAYSIEGKTLKQIKGMDYPEWLEHWKKTYGKATE
ncbi:MULTISPECIES: hypothetical protein [unclassified Paenibacillus]|uniref:hypothetical protein n=1 Tax=unclassified Paenibacillus TaxID=185978 RepID=UPI00240539B0|nr:MULTISPECIES: hypothetical protein [unclassified Paenibacillus]MDF9839072.1 hypothetical protein [Paenibacillus sp. PastF-2]MDF9845654.1 hypothetical protein [Paenibacillus sp. PastM-2]MDF9852226.1 hypothetical protein [Paenibacillus sp. PastF-1]MDH6478045.1 hypothetical protein [Paenibacillus sp. PastH-2]MDH6505780.1 hypothetical protein [Paenibacillus sp. PastM-3]